jgi:protein involved in polysaccharide export with SLBB domain
MDGKTDTLLQNRDEIAVYSIWMFQQAEKVSIWGEVKNQGYYDFVAGMTVEDLIFTAGGFTEKSYRDAAEVSRILNSQKEGNQNATEIISVKLSENFEFLGTKQMPLKKYDMIFIRPNPNWQIQKNVTVLGEVRFPGTYSLQFSNEKIAAIIERCGGLKETAYLEGSILKRSKDNVGRIALDLEKIIR